MEQGMAESSGRLQMLYAVHGKTMKVSEETDIVAHCLTHVGKVRKDNQDAVRICDSADEFTSMAGHLYGIADGMGGYSHGGVASLLALDTFFQTFYASNGISPLQKLRVGIQNANLGVCQAAQRMGAGRMGTTLTAINVIGRNLFVGHVGDSRAYLIRQGKSECLTNDHTRVGELVRMHVLPADKVRTHSQRSVLSKCLGVELFIQPDVFKISVQDDDMIILCTDGIWSVIEDEEFGEIRNEEDSPEQIGKRLIETALNRESDDNLSVAVIHLRHLGVAEYSDAPQRPWTISNLLRRIFK